MKFKIGDKVRLKEHIRNMSWEDRYDYIEDEVDSEIARWWADNPDGVAKITKLTGEDYSQLADDYFAVDDDDENFEDCWLNKEDFELVNMPSNLLEEAEEV